MDIPEDNDIPENQMKNAIQQAPGVDTEKQDAVHQDEDNNTALPSMPASAITIDPAIERRVLRKLDLRVPTLLGFLCESSPALSTLMLFSNKNIEPRSFGVTRSL
jgi:hypothetical protein